ncbi:MAG: hypothetical protein HDR53_03120 [Treponema sp.]|nr:hypothetical protein [Treponema sp.]
MKRKLVLIAMAVMAVNFSGFAEKRTKKTKINFKTEKAGNFECTNFSDSDLVLFAGRIERNFILGGIKSNETRSFNFSRISEMPEQGAFIMRAVPYETYKTKEILGYDDAVYTKLVVFDLNSKNKISISNLIDTSKKFGFLVTNESLHVVELRYTPGGETIATLPPLCMNYKADIKPTPFPLVVFPVYTYVNPKTNAVQNVELPSITVRIEEREWPLATIDIGKFSKQVDLDSLSKQEMLSQSDLTSMKLELMSLSAELEPMRLFGEL